MLPHKRKAGNERELREESDRAAFKAELKRRQK